MQALYLLDNEQIAAGVKTALATAQPRDLTGERLLVVKDDTGYRVTGTVTIQPAITVPPTEFDARVKEHCVGTAQRLKWWPTAETLAIHPLTYSAIDTPYSVEIAPGCGMCTELSMAGVKEIAVENGWHIYEVD